MSSMSLSNNQKNELLFVGFNQDYGKYQRRPDVYRSTCLVLRYCCNIRSLSLTFFSLTMKVFRLAHHYDSAGFFPWRRIITRAQTHSVSASPG